MPLGQTHRAKPATSVVHPGSVGVDIFRIDEIILDQAEDGIGYAFGNADVELSGDVDEDIGYGAEFALCSVAEGAFACILVDGG